MLICDGCDKTLGENGEYQGAANVRRIAISHGWQMIPKLKSNGTPGAPYGERNKASWSGHDVCPSCVAGFTAELSPHAKSRGGKPAWWTERIEELQARIAQLEGRR